MYDVTAYGAVGDGVHDDGPAWQAAINAAAAAGRGTVFAPAPSNVYLTNRELAVNWSTARIVSESSNKDSPTIKAGTAMRSVFAVRSSYGSPTPEDQALNRAYFEHMTIDAGLCADNAILSLGAEMSTFRDLRVVNARRSGIRVALQQNAITLGSVSGPAGLSVVQPDPQYGNVPGSAFTGTICVKACAGGTIDLSYDGGATYQGTPIPIASKMNAHVSAGGVVVGLTGLQLQFNSLSWPVGTTWSIPYTYIPGDYGIAPGVGTAQGAITYEDITYGQCGQVQISRGKSGPYSGYNTTVVDGTVTKTSGSQFLAGTGTTWTNVVGNESSRLHIQLDSADPQDVFLGYVLTDTCIAVDPSFLPRANASGLQWAIGSYGGFYEDFDATPRHVRGECGNCSNGLMFGPGGGGPIVRDFIASSAALIGMSILSPQTIIDSPFFASTAIQAIYFGQNSAGFLRNPSQAALYFGQLGGAWTVENNGVTSPLGPGGSSSYVQLYNAQLKPSATLNVTGASFTFPRPQRFWGDTGGTSLCEFQSVSNVTLTGTPVIPPGQQGQLYMLHNTYIQNGIVTIPGDASSGSGVIPKPGATCIVLPPESTAFLLCNGQGKWLQVA